MAAMMLTCEERVLLNCCVCGSLLNDPVLLPCFCSCCRGCVVAIRCGESIECPLCKEKFETCLLEKSTYVSAQFAILKASNDLSNCNLCEEEGVVVAAQYKCRECCNFLCEKCFGDHRKHVQHHNLEDLTYLCGMNTVSSPPRVMCKEHKEMLSFFCQQCKCLKCGLCMEACMTAQHGFVTLKQHLANAVKEIQSAAITLTESSVSVDSLEQVLCESETNRKKHTAYMESNKMTLLEAVTSSFVESKSAVENFIGDTVQKAQQAIDMVSLLKGKIERFSTYCKSAAESGDVVSLVNQHQHILARLTYLLNEKLNAATSITVNKIVVDDDRLENIRQIICKYVGIPKPVQVYEKEQAELQELWQKQKSEQEAQENARLELIQQLEDTQHQLQEEQLKSQCSERVLLEQRQKIADELQQLKSANLTLTQQLADSEQKVKDIQMQQQKEQQRTAGLQREKCVLLDQQKKTTEELEQLRQQLADSKKVVEDIPRQLQEEQQMTMNLRRDKCVTLESPHVIAAVPDVTFRDVAVASAGAVFVATSQGLSEYDSRGQEVSRPLTKGDVLSVDVFSDGRVAAGLRDNSVAVLSRDKAQSSREWRVTATFKSKVWPRCLAVAQDDSCLSVAGGSVGWGWGDVLCVYSCSGRLLLEKDLGYSIRGLASSTAAVVVSSWHKREPPLEAYTVEAYSYSGQLLWLRRSSNIAYDLCPDPGSIRMYTTVYCMSGVRVLRGEGQQGTEEEDMVSGSEALQEPWRMSMDRQATCLAVISGSPDTVTVFTVARR